MHNCDESATTSKEDENPVSARDETQTTSNIHKCEECNKDDLMKVQMEMQQEIQELKKQLQEARCKIEELQVQEKVYSKEDLEIIFKDIFTKTQLKAIIDKKQPKKVDR